MFRGLVNLYSDLFSNISIVQYPVRERTVCSEQPHVQRAREPQQTLSLREQDQVGYRAQTTSKNRSILFEINTSGTHVYHAF